jgi:hypothetical protein
MCLGDIPLTGKDVGRGHGVETRYSILLSFRGLHKEKREEWVGKTRTFADTRSQYIVQTSLRYQETHQSSFVQQLLRLK